MWFKYLAIAHSPDTTWIVMGLLHTKTIIPKKAMLEHKINDSGNYYTSHVVYMLTHSRGLMNDGQRPKELSNNV